MIDFEMENIAPFQAVFATANYVIYCGNKKPAN